MKTPTLQIATIATTALLCLAAPGRAQDRLQDAPADAETGIELRAGFRLGAFEMINAPDSYDAVFGDPMPMVGGQLEVRIRPRILLGVTLDYGEVDGEQVLPADPPIGTGADVTLTYIPLHVTASWRVDRGGDWAVHLGAGPSFLSWDSDSTLGSGDGTEVGGHVAASLRRLHERWIFGGDLRWSTFPDAVGEPGPTVTAFYDEDDLGGLSLHFLALRRF